MAGIFGLTQIINKLVNVRLVGGGAHEPFSGATGIVKTFAKPMSGFCLSNDSEPGKTGAGEIIFIVDGNDSYTVKPGEVFSERFEPFIQVQVISNNIPYRAYGMIAEGTTALPTAPPPDITPPNPAVNLVVTSKTDTTITLSWAASNSLDVLNYDVYEGTTISNGSLIGTANSTTFTVTNKVGSTTYNFFVRAKDVSNNRSEASNVVTVTTDVPAPDTTPPVMNPANPRGRPFELQFTVSLSATDNVAVAGIYYTLNGTNPTNASTKYASPILISGTATMVLKSIAYDTSGNASSVRTETYTYSQKTGGTGFGSAPTPIGGAWQDFVATNLPGNSNGTSGWKGSHFFMSIEKHTSHAAFTCSIAGGQAWQLWELQLNPNSFVRYDGTTCPANQSLLFAVLRADGTTATPVDTAGLGAYLIGSLQFDVLLEANKWYCIAFNNANAGTFGFGGMSDIYTNVGGTITTGHVEGVYNGGTNAPAVGVLCHSQNAARPAAYDHQVYLKD